MTLHLKLNPGARVWFLDEAGLPTGGPATSLFKIEGENMTSPARDVNLAEWLDGIGFHPANSERKQLGHEAARQLIADLGRMLHGLLPAGRDKSLVFTALEDALMRSNRALALSGGPRDDLDDDTLRRLAAHGPLEADPRIEAYKAEQRGEVITEARPIEVEHTHVTEDYSPPFLLDEGTPEDPEPSDTLRTEVEVQDDPGIVLQVAGTHYAEGGGYVDVAVVAKDPELAQECAEDARRGKMPFDGFHRVMHKEEDVTRALQAIFDAARHAGFTVGPLHLEA